MKLLFSLMLCLVGFNTYAASKVKLVGSLTFYRVDDLKKTPDNKKIEVAKSNQESLDKALSEAVADMQSKCNKLKSSSSHSTSPSYPLDIVKTEEVSLGKESDQKGIFAVQAKAICRLED